MPPKRLEAKRDPKFPARKVVGLSTKNQSKPNLGSPLHSLHVSSRVSGHRGSPAGIAIKKGVDSPVSCSQPRTAAKKAEVQSGGTLVPPRSLVEQPLIAEQNRVIYPSCPPINPFPFPKDIDLSSFPSELKRKGKDWFVLFNPSLKVKRVLDMYVVHDLVHDSWVKCVRFSQDGKWVAMGCSRTAQIYDVKTGVQTCVLDHTRSVCITSVCFSPDGKYLATGAGDSRQVRIWNITEKQILSIFEGHQRWIGSLDFSPNGQFIAFGSDDGAVRLWDVHGGALKVLIIDDHYLPDEDHVVRSVAISPDGRYLAVGGHCIVVSIWEVHTGVLVQRLRGHRNWVSSVAFTPDGKGLISGSYDGMLMRWDISGLDIGSGAGSALTSTSIISSSPCLMNLTVHNHLVTSTAVSHDGIWVASGDPDGKVLFWETRTGVAQCMLSGHKDFVRQVNFSPMDHLLATASDDGHVKIWSYGACS